MRSASCARNRRLTRCRITLLPTDLPTTSPTRTSSPAEQAPPDRAGRGTGRTTCTTRVGRPARRPRRITWAKSDESRRRCSAGNISVSGHHDGDRCSDRRDVNGERTRASGRELAAALTATGGQDRAPRTGPHTQSEAVGLGPTTVVRLEGPLAHGDSSKLLGGLAPASRVILRMTLVPARLDAFMDSQRRCGQR